MKTPNMKALKRLLFVAQNVIDYKHVNMTCFLSHNGDHPIHKKRSGLYDAGGCGTVACLFGWAATDARFVKAFGHNLHLGFRRRENNIIISAPEPMASGYVGKLMRDDVFNGIAHGLGISRTASPFLFGANMSGTKRSILARIRKVMRHAQNQNYDYNYGICDIA